MLLIITFNFYYITCVHGTHSTHNTCTHTHIVVIHVHIIILIIQLVLTGVITYLYQFSLSCLVSDYIGFQTLMNCYFNNFIFAV